VDEEDEADEKWEDEPTALAAGPEPDP
jgi:hypothetical protein